MKISVFSFILVVGTFLIVSSDVSADECETTPKLDPKVKLDPAIFNEVNFKS